MSFLADDSSIPGVLRFGKRAAGADGLFVKKEMPGEARGDNN